MYRVTTPIKCMDTPAHGNTVLVQTTPWSDGNKFLGSQAGHVDISLSQRPILGACIGRH
ncbi:MAG: hypothetical protein H6936_08460 [Burkholderiales bacterium]|nr:hypothetical protein [Burkholderiales bacterium]